MPRVEKTVFISYRRSDISWALAVYQDLTHHGYDVFFDYTSISSGDFEQIIISSIKARAHFVLILTPSSLDRCNETGDWLRREIETAIDEKRNIIPLFFDGFSFGAANVSEKLTGKLGNVSRYNGMNVHQDFFSEAMERLRTKFLNVRLNTVLHPTPTMVQKAVIKEQHAANKAARKERQRKFIERSFQLITSNSRWLGIGGIILLVLILGGFGLNYFINNLPTLTPTRTPIPTPILGIGSTMTGEHGETLVYVPAGEFLMGDDDGESDEKPVHTVYLDAFWIDQTEVTNKKYKVCVDAGICEPPSSISSSTRSDYYGNPDFDNYPVIFINWDKAKQYCKTWAGGDLPTEAQWEKTARGVDGRIYPWGNDIPNLYFLNYRSIIRDTTKVGSYESGKSPYGAYDMAGNVWEWLNDYYQNNYYATLGGYSSNPQGSTNRSLHVIRGGSWINLGNSVRSANRDSNPPTSSASGVGFRCARSAE